ncbi:alpha-L-fucosidase [Vagococcus zengguangii]|uniref:alpha-L-fucosidase n=1 Tax=Vagococcus zengguangii TaxID=2571750 RepID=A0A4D7CQ17_9ENTE|nr:alpha-L-fucosidase [Vagococcus zengguangii]QCI86178.1 alpha-L-fucosidase [Vagococcus zengguangii]
MSDKIRGDIEEAKLDQSQENQIFPETEMLKERLEWFQDLKLGVIMHWGLYAEAGIVESWQLSELDEWAREPVAWRDDVKTLQKDYWNLIESFNPVNFNAKKWAKTIKAAGFKYLIFTTKHHDGFNMYDTQFSDYKITSERSPFAKDERSDLLKEIFDAAREEGLAVGAYYSKADWYSEYYWEKNDTPKGRRTSYNTAEKPELWQKYVEFVHNQLNEITSNYGKIDLLWLDGGWCGHAPEDLQMDVLVEKLRQNQPELIVVDRMMGGRHENYVTPERKIPSLDEIPTKPWESNVPFGHDWGYVPTDEFKSDEEIYALMIDVVTKGGNVIFGLGPKPDGTFTAEEEAIMSAMGNWLSKNGEAVYGTRIVEGIPELNGWRMTQNEEAYYLIPLSLKQVMPERITIPKELLTKPLALEGEVLTGEQMIEVMEETEYYQVMLASKKHDTMENFVIKLKKK